MTKLDPALTTRAARLDDADRLASLMFLEPSRESVAMAGSALAAERLSRNLFRHALAHGTSAFVVAEISGAPVGFAEVSRGGDLPPFPVVARAAVNAFGIVGALRAAWRARARAEVDHPIPDGGVHLVELQVSPPQYRNRGVGALLLGRVDDYAIGQDAVHISLTTQIDNPARRLYHRSGYQVAGEKTSGRYERITGSPGRVLMVKQLA